MKSSLTFCRTNLLQPNHIWPLPQPFAYWKKLTCTVFLLNHNSILCCNFLPLLPELDIVLWRECRWAQMDLLCFYFIVNYLSFIEKALNENIMRKCPLEAVFLVLGLPRSYLPIWSSHSSLLNIYGKHHIFVNSIPVSSSREILVFGKIQGRIVWARVRREKREGRKIWTSSLFLRGSFCHGRWANTSQEILHRMLELEGTLDNHFLYLSSLIFWCKESEAQRC